MTRAVTCLAVIGLCSLAGPQSGAQSNTPFKLGSFQFGPASDCKRLTRAQD